MSTYPSYPTFYPTFQHTPSTHLSYKYNPFLCHPSYPIFYTPSLRTPSYPSSNPLLLPKPSLLSPIIYPFYPFPNLSFYPPLLIYPFTQAFYPPFLPTHSTHSSINLLYTPSLPIRLSHPSYPPSPTHPTHYPFYTLFLPHPYYPPFLLTLLPTKAKPFLLII